MRGIPFGPAAARERPEAYQTTLLTTTAPEVLLEALSNLDIPEAVVTERGSTYLVLAPARRFLYGETTAAFLGIAIVLVVLVALSVSVLWILLLPAALLPMVPLLVADHPSLAVGAVDAEAAAVDAEAAAESAPAGVTQVTFHGRTWAGLAGALDRYIEHLPRAQPAVREATPDHQASPRAGGNPPLIPEGPDAAMTTAPGNAALTERADNAAPGRERPATDDT